MRYNQSFVPDSIKAELESAEDDVAAVIVHYLYCECLPGQPSLPLLNNVIQFLQARNLLLELSALCEGFVRVEHLQTQFLGIAAEIHGAIDQILVLLGGRVVNAKSEVKVARRKAVGRSLVLSPSRLTAAIRQSIANIALIIIKIIEFCVLYERARDWLSNDERGKIILFVRARILFFIQQLLELLKSVKSATVALTSQQRQAGIYIMVTGVGEGVGFWRRKIKLRCRGKGGTTKG